jgi:hypothetical protein
MATLGFGVAMSFSVAIEPAVIKRTAKGLVVEDWSG